MQILRIAAPASILAVVVLACGGGAPGDGPRSDGFEQGFEPKSRTYGDGLRTGTGFRFGKERSFGFDATAADASGEGASAPTAPEELIASRHVSPSGDDASDGSASRPWRTLSHAVTRLSPGEVALVHGGTYAPFTIDQIDGTADRPITLRAAPGETPRVVGGAIDVQRAYWILDGLDVSPAGPTFAVRFRGSGAHHVTLRNAKIHDGSLGAGVSIEPGATDIIVASSEIWGFSRGAAMDSHGIVVQPGTERVELLDNHIHGNSGDSIQCIGPEQAGGEVPARDLWIEGNLLHDDRENAIDIKTCESVVIRGNRAYGYRFSDTSNGEAIVIHQQARDVLVEENEISDANRGIVVGVRAAAVVLRRNVIQDGVDERIGILFGGGDDQIAIHNTIRNVDRCVKSAGSTNVHVINNLFDGCAQSITGSAELGPNLFHLAPPVGELAVVGDPLLDDALVPSEGSAAIDAASVLPGEPAGCGAGPDLGAHERC